MVKLRLSHKLLNYLVIVVRINFSTEIFTNVMPPRISIILIKKVSCGVIIRLTTEADITSCMMMKLVLALLEITKKY